MGIGVKIDFGNVYGLEKISDDLRVATFETQLRSGNSTSLMIKINEKPHELLSNVYNLTFGPIKDNNHIDDRAELPHIDYSKVFSTILLNAYNYLEINPDHYLGVDGSENLRAWYYWRFLQRNFEYLSNYFDMFGIKYYVRISRFGKYQYDNPFDFEDIKTQQVRILKMIEWPSQMYNYFIFKKKV